jgi:hypothetical protein
VSTEFARECVELFAEVVQVFGVPPSVGQIYGLLYATPEPLSFSDIVERLGISKGSASQGLQFLRSLGAINIADAKRQALSGKREAPSGKSEVRSAKRQAHPLPLPLCPLLSAPDAPVVSPVEPSRRDYYEPELGLRRLVSGILQERVTPLATAGVGRLARLRELAERDGQVGDFYLDRVKQLETWRRRLKTVLPVLSALLGPKSRK